MILSRTVVVRAFFAVVCVLFLTLAMAGTPAHAAKKFTSVPTPTISGTAEVGKTLKVKTAKWKPKAKLKYQWYRGSSKIKGATKSTYKVVAADKGKKLKVKVTGSKSGYKTKSKTSKATKKVIVPLPKSPALKNGERKVKSGIYFVDVDRNVKKSKPLGLMDDAAVSANGTAVAYQALDGGDYPNYSLEWRDLTSGRALSLNMTWNYGMDISADGRWVVYVDAGSADSTGMVTSNRFWLWDTKTNTKKRIDLKSSGKPTTDSEVSYCERSIDISDNGKWVVFSAYSPSLSPSGAKNTFYSFAYERATGKVTPVPYKVGRAADCAKVSDNGKVALFPGWSDAKSEAYLWTISSGAVRKIASYGEFGTGSAEPAAISADGSTMVYLASKVVVTRLGATTAEDKVTGIVPAGWKDDFAGPGTWAHDSTWGEPAISGDGSNIAWMVARENVKYTCTSDGSECSGSRIGDEKVSVRHMNMKTGTQKTLSAPGSVKWLPTSKKVQNYMGTRVSLTKDGASAFVTACSRGTQSNPFRVCDNRSDLFRYPTN